MAFAHLNTHSCHSLLAGAMRPEEIPAAARRLGFASIALTDTDGLYAAVPFQRACDAEGVIPLFGVELTRPRPRIPAGPGTPAAASDTREAGGFSRERPAGPGDPRHRATLLARNDAGYRLVSEIVTARHCDRDFDLEAALDAALASGDIHVLCAGEGLLRSLTQNRHSGAASRNAGAGFPVAPHEGERGRAMPPFGGRLHVELRAGSGPGRLLRLQALLGLARNLGLPVAATAGAFFMRPEDYELHRILSAIRLGCAAKSMPSDGCAPSAAWLMDETEMRAALGVPAAGVFGAGAGRSLRVDPRLEEAMAAAARIADDCRARIPTGRPRPPRFNLPAAANGRPQVPDAFLYRLAHEGLRERLGLAPGDRDRAARRSLSALRRELHVIRRRGVSAYFLIAWDLVRHGRGRGHASLGRGSAASSLVSFALGITHVNPLEHDLYFERFLNLERQGLPDFDIDFGSESRYRIQDYAFERYGRDRTAMIGTCQSFRPRGAFRALVGALGLNEEKLDPLIKLLPRWGSCRDLRRRLAEDPRTRHLDLTVDPLPRLLDLAARLDGLPRHLGTHPCGIVIAPEPIAGIVPLQRGAQGLAITQWDMRAVEAAGLVKMDILGQRGLAVIDAVSRRVRDNFGKAPRLGGDPPSRGKPRRGRGGAALGDLADAVNPFLDKPTRKLLSEGRTEGCFYIESPIMMQILRQSRCDDFETLTALSSIIRPGVSSYGGKHSYLMRHLGLEPISVLHPLLEPLLRDTKGCLIYQEQVMRVLQVAGGLSLGEADLFRKLMSGKGGSRAECERRFMAGAAEVLAREGVPEAEIGPLAGEIWRQVSSFAGYAFCKAHSASFARESFESAWWKAHYPAEFMASVIEERGGYYATAEYVEEARRLGVEILPPHVNAGTVETLGFGADAVARDPAAGAGRAPARDGDPPAPGGIIRIGLSFVKGVRQSALTWLAKESGRRPFASLRELVERALHTDGDAPRRYEAARLVRVGALDGLPLDTSGGPAEVPDRAALLARLERLWTPAGAARADTEAFAPLPDVAPGDIAGRLRLRASEETDLLGFTPSCHPLTLLPDFAAARAGCLTARELDRRAAALPAAETELGRVDLIGLKVAGKSTRTARGGKLMAFITFSDETGNFEAVLYPRDYARLARRLRGPGPFRITGAAGVELGQPLVAATDAVRL